MTEKFICPECKKIIDMEKVNANKLAMRYFVAFGFCPDCTIKNSNYAKKRKVETCK